MEPSYYIEADDIVVKPLEPELCECEDGVVSHEVTVDFRSAGFMSSVFQGCETCANEVASRIREGIWQLK